MWPLFTAHLGGVLRHVLGCVTVLSGVDAVRREVCALSTRRDCVCARV